MASRDRILILGGSHSELPLIDSAQRMGLEVVTSGNQSDHPGHRVSDRYLPGDFSDLEEMEEVLAQSGCRYVVAAANDYAYLTACQLAQRHAMPGFDPYETAILLHHKHLFKPLASLLGLPITRFKVVEPRALADDAAVGLSYPLMVKPVDLTGGKGMTLVHRPEQLPEALAYASAYTREPKLVIEEFFEGTLHSYSTIVQNGQVIFEYADNEFCQPNPFLVTTSTSLASVPLHILADLRFQTEKLARHLHLCDGVLHAQFLYGAGEYRILEYTRRSSGDLYSAVVEQVTGMSHAEQFIRQSLGLPTHLAWGPKRHNFVSRHCIFAEHLDGSGALEISPALQPYVKQIVPAWPADHVYMQPHAEKAAVVILQYPSLKAMTEITSKIHGWHSSNR